MDILTLDFETFYSTEFSLTRLTTEEYINDDRFEVIGVSVKVNNTKTRWFTGTHKATAAWLAQFDWENSAIIGHNLMFDAAILAWRFDIHPKAMFDTLSMARAVHGTQLRLGLGHLAEHYGLGVKGKEVIQARGKRRKDFTISEMEAYGGYCRNDSDLTYKLFRTLMATPFPKAELKLIDTTLRMFTQPVLELDLPALEEHLIAVQNHKEALMARVDVDRKTLMSNAMFADALRALGVEPPMKISPRTGKEAFAFAKTDEGFKALAEYDNIEVQALVSARLGVKTTIEETRTERFIGISKRTGLLPIPLGYYRAHTGRWGGMDKINMQNLPSRGPTAGALKRAITAPEGYVILEVDSSQIEARMVAWLAGQTDLLEAFENKEDVYKIMAGAIYGKHVRDVSPSERHVGKETILGCGYGMGRVRFREALIPRGIVLEMSESEHVINTYRSTYRRIPALWRQGQVALEAMVTGQHMNIGPEGVLEFCAHEKGFRLPSGMWLRFPTLERSTDADNRPQFGYTSRRGFVHMHGPKLIENISQSLARCVVAEQMLKINLRYRPILTVHDSVMILAREEEAERAAAYLTRCMSWRPMWAKSLPLACEVAIGHTYGDLIEHNL